MKLLYLWINENETNFISQEGVNLSVNYHFNLTIIGEKYVLSCEQREGEIDLFERENIVGLTAIIGANGSGKTSILNELLSQSIFPNQKMDDPAYLQYTQERNWKGRRLRVYLQQNRICIYHNIPEQQFENKTGYEVVAINEIADKSPDTYNDIEKQLMNQTIIYISNSGYCPHAKISSLLPGQIDSFTLTSETIGMFSKNFFKKVFCLNNNEQYIAQFFNFQKLLYSSKKTHDFQQLCDICYFSYINNIGKPKDQLFPSDLPDIELAFINPIVVLEKNHSSIDDSFKQEISSYARKYNEWKREHCNIDYIPLHLYDNLIFEMCFLCNLELPDIDIKDADGYITIIQSLISEYENRTEKNHNMLEYYKLAENEVQEIIRILSQFEECENTLPPSDLAYEKYVRITPNKEEIYKAFCETVIELMNSQSSFVLKYIAILHDGYSSGERAILNLFSWLSIPLNYSNLIEHQHRMDISNNVLLMIDEIDLYLHPEWQRLIIHTLMTKLVNEYKNHRIQVLISTHSPLVLSDIPLDNCIFLHSKDNQFAVFDNCTINKTFGANIYDILNNAFFIKKSIGEFSYREIKKITDDLLLLKENPDDPQQRDKCKDYLRIIDIIGSSILKYKLRSLYYDCFQNREIDQLRKEIGNINRLKSDLSVDSRRELVNQLKAALRVLGEETQDD